MTFTQRSLARNEKHPAAVNCSWAGQNSQNISCIRLRRAPRLAGLISDVLGEKSHREKSLTQQDAHFPPDTEYWIWNKCRLQNEEYTVPRHKVLRRRTKTIKGREKIMSSFLRIYYNLLSHEVIIPVHRLDNGHGIRFTWRMVRSLPR